VPLVDKIQIQRLTANRNRDIVDTVGAFMNLPLQTFTPAGGTACVPFQYHQEVGTVSNGVDAGSGLLHGHGDRDGQQEEADEDGRVQHGYVYVQSDCHHRLLTLIDSSRRAACPPGCPV
jgi:hypothetical protein